MAMPRAKEAMDAPVRIALPPLRLMEARTFNKNRQRRHTTSRQKSLRANFLFLYRVYRRASQSTALACTGKLRRFSAVGPCARLHPAPLRRPVHKILHLVPIFPEDFQKLRSAELFRLFTQKG